MGMSMYDYFGSDTIERVNPYCHNNMDTTTFFLGSKQQHVSFASQNCEKTAYVRS